MLSSYWPAVYALRSAESLAQLGVVAGPADAPPDKQEDSESWVQDWITRAKDALAKAKQMHDEAARRGLGVLRDRARKIGERIVTGTRAIVQAQVATAKKVSKEVLRQLDEIHADARAVAIGWTATQVALALAAGVVLVMYLRKGV